jgi:hypothetical protein
MDPSLEGYRHFIPALRRKRIRSERYSRARLFAKMAAAQPVIFSDFNVTVEGPARRPLRDKLVAVYLSGFPKNHRVRCRLGPAQRLRLLSVSDLLRRWEAGRARLNVTDFHFRGTRVETGIGIDALSDFNLLLLGSGDVALQEMMTLVISSAGSVTDSHSDDPDGSNHCFVGTKLWLVWDTFEGAASGLQDISRDDVSGCARFDMRTFLALRSSRWFLVSDGETLFLPGGLTHKVLTLRPYLGVGSFYVSLPNCIATLVRWHVHRPLWSLNRRRNDHLVAEITRIATLTVRELREMPRSEQARWGLPYFDAEVERFLRQSAPSLRSRLLKLDGFAALVTSAEELGAYPRALAR